VKSAVEEQGEEEEKDAEEKKKEEKDKEEERDEKGYAWGMHVQCICHLCRDWRCAT